MSTSTPISEPTDNDIESRMQEFIGTVVDERNIDAVDAFVAPEFVMLDAADDPVLEGIEGARTYFECLLGAFPDLSLETEELLVDAGTGRLMLRYVASGTHDGELPIRDDGSVPATGEAATWQGVIVARLLEVLPDLDRAIEGAPGSGSGTA